MKKFFALFAMVSLMMAGPVLASAVSTGMTQVELPCRERGHGGEQACVVIHKFVSGAQPTVSAAFTTDASVKLQGRAKVFSVIYNYHVYPNNDNSTVGLNIHRGGSGIMGDIKMGQENFFWVTTHDGGKTWSDIKTTNMGSVISY